MKFVKLLVNPERADISGARGLHKWCWKCCRTEPPPESIPANILTVCRLICPNYDVVIELPSSKFVRECRCVLAVQTKILGAYQIARAPRLIMHHSDDTSRRGITFGNSGTQLEDERGPRTVALSSAIVEVDGTAENQVAAIERTFAEGRDLLRNWREVTARMFPNRQDLLDQLPLPLKLTLARFHNKGWIMTDTCNTARKFRRLLREHIVRLAKEENPDITEEEINVLEADCWHHLRNVWLKEVVKRLGELLSDALKEDLEAIHFTLRVTTDVNNLLMASEKYFGLQANYVKVRSYAIHYFEICVDAANYSVFYSCREREVCLIGGPESSIRAFTFILLHVRVVAGATTSAQKEPAQF